MKTKANNELKIEFTRGSSIAPLPGIRSTDVNSSRDEKEGSKGDNLSELVQKNVVRDQRLMSRKTW